jgi:hypothetical protein
MFRNRISQPNEYQSCFIYGKFRLQISAQKPDILKNVCVFPQSLHILAGISTSNSAFSDFIGRYIIWTTDTPLNKQIYFEICVHFPVLRSILASETISPRRGERA